MIRKYVYNIEGNDACCNLCNIKKNQIAIIFLFGQMMKKNSEIHI